MKVVSRAREMERERKVGVVCVKGAWLDLLWSHPFAILILRETTLLHYCTKIRCNSVSPLFSPSPHTRSDVVPYDLHQDSDTLQ